MRCFDLVLAVLATLCLLASVTLALESNPAEAAELLDADLELLDRETRAVSSRSQNRAKSNRRRSRRARNRRRTRRNRRRRVKPTPRPQPSTAKPSRARARPLSGDEFLEKFGYLAKPRGGAVQHSAAARMAAIRNFQQFNHLKVTGYLDAATRKQMAKPRCGLPDFIPHGVNPGLEAARNPSRNPEKYYVPGFKWKKNRLTWLARNYSPDLPSGIQRRAFYVAFDHWNKVAPLEFQEIGGGDPDIEIKFGSYEHGDGPQNSFDGRGGTLAHAYFPENGDTHFDESETWTDGTTEGTNLMIVAAHEFGHALGLGHSNVRGALMAPYYQGYDPNFKLHDDDIMAIQSLYGARPRPTPRPTPPPPTSLTPTRKPTRPGDQPPDTCTTKYDAVLQAHDYKVYIFKGKWLWSATTHGVEEGYPKLISEKFKSPPANIGAAVYSWRTRRTFFFKGRYVFKYLGFERESRTKMTDPNYPSHPHAAMMGRDGRIYLLQKDRYYMFDEYNMRVLNIGRRRIAGLWNGVPNNIEAAVRLRDGYVYFFKGSKYRKYDEQARKVVDGYPKDKAPAWMGPVCNKGRWVPK